MSDIDTFAVRVVVREGRKMALNRDERALAAHLMWHRRGLNQQVIAERLGVSDDLVFKMLKKPPPMSLDLIGNVS